MKAVIPFCRAYLAWIWGRIAHAVAPQSVIMISSRGDETEETITLVRSAVLFTEALALAALLAMAGQQRPECGNCEEATRVALVSRMERPSMFWVSIQQALQSVTCFLSVMCALVDHGHTQHNSIPIISTSAWAVLMSQSRDGCWWDLLAVPCFVLALNFKQMSLYFALPVFVCHVVVCVSNGKTWTRRIVRISLTGVFVVISQIVFLFPLCRTRSACSQQIAQILHRVFPTARGLFEDKVANVWCVTEPLFRTQQLLREGTLNLSSIALISALATLILCLPALLYIWRVWPTVGKPFRAHFLLVSCSISALAFFLFAIQVHEKSILFSLVSLEFGVWLLPHRSRVDGQETVEPHAILQWFRLHALVSVMLLFREDGISLAAASVLALLCLTAISMSRDAAAPQATPVSRLHQVLFVCQAITFLADCSGLRPERLPHIFSLGLAVFSFLAFFIVWAQLCMYLYASSQFEKKNTVSEQVAK